MMKSLLILLFTALFFTASLHAGEPSAEWTREGTMWESGEYTYDAAGNITFIGNDAYTYDQAGRLLTGTAHTPAHSANQSFGYDRYGNVTTVTQSHGGVQTIRSMAVVTATNQLQHGSYDPSGNQRLVPGTSVSYAWDAVDMMTVLRDGTARVEHYVYDADDERIVVVTAQQERYSPRGLDKKVARDFVRDSGTGAWTIDSDYVHRGPTLLASFRSDGVRHFHVDHLGTPRLVTDASGYKLALRTYWPFGAEVPSSEWLPERLQFTGHERDFSGDPDRDVDYMHARYYGPGWARFASVDPVLSLKRSIREPQSWNRYSYVVNNPINRIDPDGRMDGNGMGEPAGWRCPGCTRAEQLEQSNEIAKGTIIGGAVSLAIMAGPTGWRALSAAALNWIRGNPGAVQTIANAAEALASPAGPSASPGLPHIAKQLETAERIGTALKSDPTHRAASLGLDAVAKAGQSFPLKGNDGVMRTLVQAPGTVNGKAGIFEYIINKAGQVTHQRFIVDGVIEGTANQKPRR